MHAEEQLCALRLKEWKQAIKKAHAAGFVWSIGELAGADVPPPMCPQPTYIDPATRKHLHTVRLHAINWHFASISQADLTRVLGVICEGQVRSMLLEVGYCCSLTVHVVMVLSAHYCKKRYM